MSAPPANITRRLHISFTPSVPSSSSEELAKSLTTHLSKFGTVKSVDGLGKQDSVGLPRKFGFISIEGAEASIAKCVNSLSGSIWKGVKVRVGDARPDFEQRIAQENAAEPPPPRRKRKRGGVLAEDMSLVTPENAAERAGWKVSEMGRVMRPVRIRPERPLPPPLTSSAPKKPATSKDKDAAAKPKKRRDPDSRARKRTIDMTRWGSVHLKGIFLEDAGLRTADPELSQDEVEGMVEVDLTDSDNDSDDGGVQSVAVNAQLAAPTVKITPDAAVAAPKVKPTPAVVLAAPAVKPTAVAGPKVAPTAPTTVSDADVDLVQEKTHALSLLNSLFGGTDKDWGGRESVGSDVDEEELLKIGGTINTQGDEDAIEFVPMDVDVQESAPSPKIAEVALALPPPPKKVTQATKLKDLFVSREEDAGFSLLGHLDLDLELDDELGLGVPTDHTPAAARYPQFEREIAAAAPGYAAHTLDPKQALFFPLPTSFSSSSEAGMGFSTKARLRDVLDVGKDYGWGAHFCRTESEEVIRAKWEEGRGELTQGWKRRCREAGKVRKRRGGGDGD
ncbi:hypothetical protein B0H17DRAFT_1159120 [Mycena rosella]|uniref:RRM domain-containing protein n=1 Tax=Mycena rosella TaxID=1033263 RepID=A0AAD7DM64_MYCRO|nr:hypothetical protein B0H17DRAFT_1159120 [Mycena rosella]